MGGGRVYGWRLRGRAGGGRDRLPPSSCWARLACLVLFIAALVSISAWCLQSGSAYYLPSFLPPSFWASLSHIPHHASLSPTLTLTLCDICFTTCLTSFLFLPISFSHPGPFCLFCLSNFPLFLHASLIPFYRHSDLSSPGLSPDHWCISVVIPM